MQPKVVLPDNFLKTNHNACEFLDLGGGQNYKIRVVYMENKHLAQIFA